MKTTNILVDSIRRKISILNNQLVSKHGTYSSIYMGAAGFHYINKDDTVRCDQCHLEVSEWTEDMNPFTIHTQRSPMCPFVQSISLSGKCTSICQSSDINERPTKRLKTENPSDISSSCELTETESLKQVRKRTFSHWPPYCKPSVDQLIEAGFFGCNVGDRVICIYCNKIFQQWTSTDDPCEVHRTLAPDCPYVTKILTNVKQSAVPIVNELSEQTNPVMSCDQLVTTEAIHIIYKEIPKRYASFESWQAENQPSVDDLVRAGFFYTGSANIVTCFYCNGSLQNWGATDNPMIEHARWFSNCHYIRQLCGDKLFNKIQRKKSMHSTKSSHSTQISTIDDSNLMRYVFARLDLPMSQRMLDLNFKLSVIKRCWEDQLRLKQDDFVSATDLFMACTILQKQVDHIDGKKENIIIPIRAMNEIHERESIPIESASTDVITMEKKEELPSPSNPCALCLTEEKCLAFIPCGHVASCVPCGHSLKSCPICRSQIKASVRVYL